MQEDSEVKFHGSNQMSITVQYSKCLLPVELFTRTQRFEAFNRNGGCRSYELSQESDV